MVLYAVGIVFCLSKHRSVAVVEPPVIGSPEHVGNKMLRADVGQNRALVVADGAAARPVDDHNSGCDHACTPGSKTGAETTPRAAEGGGPLFIGRDKGSGITRICSEGEGLLPHHRLVPWWQTFQVLSVEGICQLAPRE